MFSKPFLAVLPSPVIYPRRTHSVSAACGLLLFLACSGGDNQSPKLRVLDLRKAPADEDWAVVFCARPTSGTDRSFFGHAFIILSYNDTQKKACIAKALGFFPEKDGDALNSVFKDVPSTVTDDFLRNKPASGTCRLIVRVTQPQFASIQQVLMDWSKKGYRLGKKDCVSFVIAVGDKLKLKLPPRSGFDNLPIRFMEKMTEDNGELEK
jgi:hypothetical protein